MIINCCHLQVIQDIQSQLDSFKVSDSEALFELFGTSTVDLLRVSKFLNKSGSQCVERPSIVTSLLPDSDFLFRVEWFDNLEDQQ